MRVGPIKKKYIRCGKRNEANQCDENVWSGPFDYRSDVRVYLCEANGNSVANTGSTNLTLLPLKVAKTRVQKDSDEG